VHKTVFLDGKKSHGTFEFFVEFVPVRMLSQTMEVPGIYFKETKGNDVKFYCNADDDGSAPIVKYGGQNDDDKVYTPPRLWRDIYDSICNAKHLIYMVGWSIDVDQWLLRGDELKEAQANSKYSPRIGDLLKQKSEEGVAVNLMQWDDYSSNFAFPGMMNTYDEKTRNFFRNTKVNSEFMHTVGDATNTLFEGQNKKMAFTHHQKFVIVDVPKSNGEGRELLAFVGGIDLTAGRWDNRKHPLFRSLQSQHKGDIYGKCFKTSEENGPRQPWHDIHSAVRGPEALQLHQAFTERWTKQAPEKVGELCNLRTLNLDSESALSNNGGWHAQLSRSIDSRVNNFDPSIKQLFRSVNVDEQLKACNWTSVKEEGATASKRFETASYGALSFNRCLDQKKGRLVENSIHITNVHHIRRAKHFIYIESQYFMGSSFMWSNPSERDVKCANLIAAELTLKICEKVAAREPFACYILLPMWMEGIPEAGATQGLLYWQRVTIEAMYQQVQEAVNARMANSSDFGLKVSDYLNFYCLGTRETAEGSQATGTPTTEDEQILHNTRRHQIYIHSKMMIVDDEVALIGTANINQRSMDGCRDSEIMLTSWHPDYLATKDSIPKGDIHAFRLHTWASITGVMDDAFRNPSSPECVKAMNSIADKNWQRYMGETTVDMDSHLLPFPLEFENGKIKPRKGLQNGKLPDTQADALGKKSVMLPEIFLT
jgi:phospholipase D1/2